MKTRKHFTPLLLILAVGMALTACQKCETCSYTTRNTSGEESTYYFPETCGPKYKRQIQRETCETTAAYFGSTCVCTKN